MSTKLDRLTELAKEEPKRRFFLIAHLITPEALYAAMGSLRKDASAGWTRPPWGWAPSVLSNFTRTLTAPVGVTLNTVPQPTTTVPKLHEVVDVTGEAKQKLASEQGKNAPSKPSK